LLRKFTAWGQRLFPTNPQFYFLEADSYIAQGPLQFPGWKVQPLLNRARELAQQLPAGEEQKTLLEMIDQRQQMMRASNLLNNPGAMGMMEDMFGMNDDDLDDYQDDEDFEFADSF